MLDEATSALDVNTENAIQGTIDKIMVGTTTVIVAQRLSTVKRAKQIVVIDQGTVIESGTYEELIEKEGHFKRLLGFQKENEKKIDFSTEVLEEDIQIIGKRQEIAKVAEGPQKKGVDFSRVFSLLKDYRPLVVITIASSLLAGTSTPVFSYFLALNCNVLIDPNENDKVVEVFNNFLFITAASLAVLIGMVIMSITLARMAQLITYELRYKSLNSLLYYDQKFYDRPKSAPSLLSLKLSDDCEKVSNLGGPIIGLLLFVLTGMLGAFAIGMAHDAILSVFIIAFLAFLYFAGKGEGFAKKGFGTASLERTSVIASDTYTNIKTVQSFNRQEYFYNRYISTTSAENAEVVRHSYFNGLVFGFRYFILFSIWGSVAWYGAYRVTEGDLSFKYMMVTLFCVILTNLAFVILHV